MTELEQKQWADFHDGTLAAAVNLIADGVSDPVVQSTLWEAAAKLKWAAGELVRREVNERRNCINWGPCSLHDARMGEGLS